jgi:hypothetical protein
MDSEVDTGQKSLYFVENIFVTADFSENVGTAVKINIQAGPNTTITRIVADWQGDGYFEDYHDNIDQQNYKFEHIGQFNATPGSFTPTMRVFYTTPTGVTSRDFTGNEFTVVEEQADYSPDDSFQKTKDKIEELSDLIGNNINTVFINTNYHYSDSDVREILEVYTNGTIGDQNPELDRVIIKDGTNSVDYRRTDGGTAVWAGFTETQMDKLKDIYR